MPGCQVITNPAIKNAVALIVHVSLPRCIIEINSIPSSCTFFKMLISFYPNTVLRNLIDDSFGERHCLCTVSLVVTCHSTVFTNQGFWWLFTSVGEVSFLEAFDRLSLLERRPLNWLISTHSRLCRYPFPRFLVLWLVDSLIQDLRGALIRVHAVEAILNCSQIARSFPLTRT